MDLEEDDVEEEDDSEIGGDLELDEEERRMLEMAELEDEADLDNIENLEYKLEQQQSALGKKRKRPV